MGNTPGYPHGRWIIKLWKIREMGGGPLHWKIAREEHPADRQW